MAEVVDVRGAVVGRSVRPVPQHHPAGPRAGALDAAAPRPRPVDAPAGPVGGQRRPTPWTGSTGRLIHLPDAPFLVGDLDPVSS